MKFIINHQLEIMFVLGCFCLLLAVFGIIMKIQPKKKKISLIMVEISTMILLFADRYAYIYRGNITQTGYYMVRISNFLVFTMNYVILDAYNTYMQSLLRQLGHQIKIIKLLRIIRPITIIGVFLIVLSQFTGLYYTFDEYNLYHRSSGFIICYILPLLMMILHLCILLKIRQHIRKVIFYSLMIFSILPLSSSIIQIFAYGISLTNISIGLSAVILFALAIEDRNQVLVEATQKEIDNLIVLNRTSNEQFRQTALALATAIDAKDEYTHGHSRRVAEYSRQIAKLTGKSLDTCEKVYFAALLHDVGKIGIPDSILTKEGRLTDEEFSVIKQHPELGNNILKEVSSSPYLSIGAHYHHEKYNGKGYPEGLSGEDIPELARIIAVADAYDAMTSSRSYRTPLAQQKVREELVRGLGTQFDPEYATAMIHILDKDTEYTLRDDIHRFDGHLGEYTFDEYKKKFTDGIPISNHITRISFTYESLEKNDDCVPSIIVFDSLDGKNYADEVNQKKMDYTDFCEISFQGNIVPGQIRDCNMKEYENDRNGSMDKNEAFIETVRQRDHVQIKIIFAEKIREYTLALRDRSQFAFISIAGKKCVISDFMIHKFETPVEDGYIKRIAEEISYIRGKKEGDLKNLEIAGWRENHSDGIQLKDKLKFSFHTMSLPAANRLWHCPILVIYTSDNGKINGPDYREFALVRFDGESWEEDEASTNQIKVSFDSTFTSWDDWKRQNHEGLDCTITIEKKENQILLTAKDGGIKMDNTTTLSEDIPKLYCSLTGDQVAITAIRVKEE